MLKDTIVLHNGTQVKPLDAIVPAFDRSFLYGDGLYEVVRSWHGKLLYMQDHLDRLEASARLAHLKLTTPLKEIQSQIEKAYGLFRQQPGCSETDAYVRLIVSRGIGKIGFGTGALLGKNEIAIIAMPLVMPSAELFKNGYRMRFVDRLRNHPNALSPAMKSGNYLNNLLAYIEATEMYDADDALLCDGEGFVTEGTTFNVGYIKRGIFVTPPTDVGILVGITRKHLLTTVRNLGYEVREVRYPKQRMLEADECFLTSTIRDIFPITQIDGKKIGNGKPGLHTLRIREAFQRMTKTIHGISA